MCDHPEMRRPGQRERRIAILAIVAGLLGAAAPAGAQPRILPLGDSITNGGQGYVSYRYELWFELEQASILVDFVGSQSTIYPNDPPNAAWYPEYFGAFDPDHEGYWGERTDEILARFPGLASSAQPDIVLIHLGTNDIGQNGAQGVIDADTNLRAIIAALRAENPAVAILLARIIPIGCCSGYQVNAGQVGPLNAAIDQIVLDLHDAAAPVLAVDLNTGFDLATMMQGDGLHPNLVGEAWLADRWRAVLEPLLPAGNPPPEVEITSPVSGASFVTPATLEIAADAADVNGSVSRVRFYADGLELGEDTSEPFTWTWVGPTLGSHVLTAVAEDDGGATETSDPVAIDVVPPGAPVAVPVSNASFEEPVLGDFGTAPGPATYGGWVFSASANTFLGVFNPPAGSYPTAGGNGTPTGADGVNAAYLFNNGGPAEFVEATQLLGESLQPDSFYELRVAIGRFLPGQPYVFSTWGGYRIELLAGATVIASDSVTVAPDEGEFLDASASVASSSVDPTLLGQALSIRLTLASSEAPRSTHFDDVRLTRLALPEVPALSPLAGGALVAGLLWAGRCGRARRRAVRCTRDPG